MDRFFYPKGHWIGMVLKREEDKKVARKKGSWGSCVRQEKSDEMPTSAPSESLVFSWWW